MKICGYDGEELRCCKTGLTIHDTNYHPDSRFQADLFFCPICHMLFIQRAAVDYFDSGLIPHVTITHDEEERLLWDVTFANKILEQYGVDVYEQVPRKLSSK
jgi:hypothetical protein